MLHSLSYSFVSFLINSKSEYLICLLSGLGCAVRPRMFSSKAVLAKYSRFGLIEPLEFLISAILFKLMLCYKSKC